MAQIKLINKKFQNKTNNNEIKYLLNFIIIYKQIIKYY